MCGLTGEFRFDNRPADLAAVGLMCDAMVSRGPDDSGAYAHGSLALGHRRLSIIDLSPYGHQPMIDAELGLTVIFNGCIYNYRELRDELRGHGYRFFSTSDTEVIAKAYHRWGEDFVDHLIGMFALAIHERDTGRLVLARDRLGIKPLYLAETPDRLRFASTLPALVRAGDVDTSIDPVALHHYLSWHAVVPAPHTILSGVRKLPPATVRVVEPDGASRERVYWDPAFTRDPAKAGWSATDWEEAVLESVRVAVRRRLVADVPVGVLLSGGLDSSLVVGLLAQEGQTGLNTFSIGFDAVSGEEGDEFKYSDVVAREFGTEHHRIRVGADLLPSLGDAVAAMSEPMVSHDAVAFYLLSKEVSRHVKVVQSGQGADEVFAGYHWYPPLAGVGRDDAVATYAKAFFDRDHAGMAEVVAPEHLAGGPVSLDFVREHFTRDGAETAVDAALRLDTQIMLTDDPVKRVDNMTMAWGLEARVPFLDHELVELAAQCPPELKLAQEGKGVLKEAARRVIPHEVIDRPKGYFPVPALKYLQGPYLELVEDALHSAAARDRGLFRPEYVDRLRTEPNADLTPLRGNRLWQLGLLELWLQTHLPGGGAVGVPGRDVPR
ncbi:N-acetylglutaminylglutamine amidotransferase [Jiangella ureilytica]|uniref:asparagine synthase (glutamine-hydrolyzing) n=1 Tax=Jiangella ureilytica TaxID=2530374 RepID=A0A4R4RC19_9ACTN|nr:N-acetylglutaminylglutamine amidotransferase [Jiangella ureilytica]TDC46656.1 N-acetylglutaminylglutamine amidotransferase [Jiangella ureilytica]